MLHDIARYLYIQDIFEYLWNEYMNRLYLFIFENSKVDAENDRSKIDETTEFLEWQAVNSMFTNVSKEVTDNGNGEDCRKELRKTVNDFSPNRWKMIGHVFYCFG